MVLPCVNLLNAGISVANPTAGLKKNRLAEEAPGQFLIGKRADNFISGGEPRIANTVQPIQAKKVTTVGYVKRPGRRFLKQATDTDSLGRVFGKQWPDQRTNPEGQVPG